MKNKFIIITLTCGIVAVLSSCAGDNSSRNVKDTINNRFGAKDSSKVDTSKMTSPDNSATGGTKPKDTSKKDTAKK